MASKKYIVSLSVQEREALEQLTTTGKAAAYRMNHARILLKADPNQADGDWTDEAISRALDISVATLGRNQLRDCPKSVSAATTQTATLRWSARSSSRRHDLS